MRLRDEGALDLADPVGDHLPEIAAVRATIGQLLSHTGGLPAETQGPWWERTPGRPWAQLAAGSVRPLGAAGGPFHYSNLGYGVLGELIARRRGLPWLDVISREILGPLGMADTTARPRADAAPGLGVHPFADLVMREPEHDAAAMAPAGQLWSTVADLARWAAFLGGATGDVLDVATLRHMCRPAAVVDEPGLPWTRAHGSGLQLWNLDGRRFCGHGGSMPGFLAKVMVDPASGDGAVMLANATSGLTDLCADLLAILAESEPPAPTPWVRRPSHLDVVDLVGAWFWGTTPLTARAVGQGRVRLGEEGDPRGDDFALDDGVWVGLNGYFAGETLQVIRDVHGQVSHLDVASFRLTRAPYDPAADIPGGVDDLGWR
jgi:CubicO group peptidase (beta-lactamase class C family)